MILVMVCLRNWDSVGIVNCILEDMQTMKDLISVIKVYWLQCHLHRWKEV